MRDFFGVGFYGRQEIVSHHCICNACRKLTSLSSYSTGKFLHIRQFPLIPLGKAYIIDECPHCGFRGITSFRKYRKKRAKDEALMQDCFATDADNVNVILNGLHTLMAYHRESWFASILESFGHHFETHGQVQLMIAEGLFRFGQYAEAETYCRKASVLGAGSRAEELLSLCQSRLEKEEAGLMEWPDLEPESMLRPYTFSATIVVCLLTTLVVGGISATCNNHAAWLVNGLHIPYSVEIDGSRYRLGRYGRRRIKLRLGEHRMLVQGLAGCESPVLFSYKIPLFKQKVGRHVLVLNPDTLAVIVEEGMVAGEATNRYLFGDAVNALSGIDYPFSDFPLELIARHSSPTRLFNRIPSNHLEMVEFFDAHGDPSAAARYARRILEIDPVGTETKNLLQIATSDLSTKQAIDFLQYGKAILPPLPVWHCFYQNLMEVRHPKYDLLVEYTLFCKAHPDQPGYYYLLGRVVRTRSTARALFEKAEDGQGIQGLGYYAIAYDLLCSGQFKAALGYSKKALQKSPDRIDFKELDREIHLALRQYDYPLRQIRSSLESDPDNGKRVAEEIKYLTLLGEHKAAIEAMNGFPSIGGDWQAYFNAVRFYAAGNATGYLECLLSSDRDFANKWQLLLFTGKVEAARDLLSVDESHEYTEHLILYCAAKYYGYPEIAETELAKAIAELGDSMSVRKEISSILSGNVPPPIAQLLDLRIWPREKAILCTSLGFEYPSQRTPFFNLSRKFNYTPAPPQLLLATFYNQESPPHAGQRR